jgi:hypothetical protein
MQLFNKMNLIDLKRRQLKVRQLDLGSGLIRRFTDCPAEHQRGERSGSINIRVVISKLVPVTNRSAQPPPR